jgi:hypothetical protein
MTRVRPLRRRTAALVGPLTAALAALAAPAVAPAQARATEVLDADLVTTAIVRVRNALPEGWRVEDIRWDTLPRGWSGDSTCVKLEVVDGTRRLPGPSGDALFHPFYNIWFLPTGWEGRMEVTEYEEASPTPVYLGERDGYRVLYGTAGRNGWTTAPEEIAAILELTPYPLDHRPRHTLDVGAMQRLFQRLDTATGGRSLRWQRQIYGITELPEVVYVELLTWEQRGDPTIEDPTFLGEIAERETDYLARQTLAAFPNKRALYLRRVTERSFSDVLVVNPSLLAAGP